MPIGASTSRSSARKRRTVNIPRAEGNQSPTTAILKLLLPLQKQEVFNAEVPDSGRLRDSIPYIAANTKPYDRIS